MRTWLRERCLVLGLAIDQLAHVLLMPLLFYKWPKRGDEDLTISHHLGVLKLRHGGQKIRWSYPLARIIDWGLEKIDPGHSIGAVETDELLTRVLRLIEKAEKDRDGE